MNYVGSLKGQVWPIQRVRSVLGGAAGIEMLPCTLSKGSSEPKSCSGQLLKHLQGLWDGQGRKSTC